MTIAPNEAVQNLYSSLHTNLESEVCFTVLHVPITVLDL